MSDDEEQNQDEKNIEEENENLEENMEENTEGNTEVDIDHGNEIEEELEYEEKLKQYFEEIEQKYGIDYANKVREKIIGAKQLEHFLDLNEWSFELAKMEVEVLTASKAKSELIFKIFKEEIAQMKELRKSQLELIAESRQLNREMHDRYLKSFDETDELERKDHVKMQELLELKRQKLAKELAVQKAEVD